MATEVENLVYVIEVQDNASAVFGKLNLSMGKLASSVIDSARKMGEATVDFVKDSVKAYAAFEDQLGGARKTMGLTNEDTEALGKRLRALALDFSETGLAAGASHQVLAEISELAGQMGIGFEEGSKDFDTFVKTVAMATGAFKMGAEDTATALGQILNNFNLTMNELPGIAGAFDIIGNASLANESKLLQFSASVGTMADDFGLTAEQMIAFGGVFGDAGVSMDVASTAMTQTFIKLRTELDKFAEILAPGGITKEMLEFKIRSGDMAGAVMLVSEGLARIGDRDALAADQALKSLGFEGKKALQAFYALKNGQEDFIKYQAMIADPLKNSESLIESYRAALDTMNARFKQAGVIINDVRMTIGEKLANAIEKVMENNIIPLLSKVQEWIKKSPVAKALFEAMGQAIEWVGEQVGFLGEKFLAWIQSLDTATAGAKIEKWFQDMGKKVKAFWQELKNTDWKAVWDSFVGVLKVVKGILEALNQLFTKMGKANNAAFKESESTLSNMKEMWEILKYTVNETGTTFQKTIDGSIMAVQKLGEAIAKAFKEGMEWVSQLAKKIADTLSGGAFGKLLDMVKKTDDEMQGKSLWPDAVEWAGKTADAVGTVADQMQVLGSGVVSVNRDLTATAQEQMATFEALIAQQQRMQGLVGSYNPDTALQYQDWAMRQQYGDMWSEAAMRFPAGVTAVEAGAAVSSGNGGGANIGNGVGAGIAGNGGTDARTGGGGAFWQPQNQVTQQQAAAPVTVTINAGANLVDSYSLERFALVIQQQMQSTGALRVIGG